MDIKIKSEKNGTEGLIVLEGSIDTRNAHEFEEAVIALGDDLTSLVIDCGNLEYMSSSGLRVLIMAYKKLSANSGTVKVKDVKPSVKEVFDMTGLFNFLTLI